MSNVSGVIKSIQDIMRKDVGVDGDAQRISQLVWLFFLKILDDREDELELTEDDYQSPLPEKLRWRNWAKDSEGITGDELLNFVNNELFPTLKNELKVDGDDNKRALVIKNVFEDAYNYMKSGTLLRQVINKICEINFNASGDRHTFGSIYEQILKDLQSAGNAGEFYTPRAVTTFIVDRIAPQLEETVLDPACGTGGFLTNVIEYKRNNFVKSPAEEEILQRTIFGVEKKAMPHMLCTTNMILHGIDVPINIKHDNTLARPLRDYTNADRVNIIVTNPPFGGMEEDGIENNFPSAFKTRETANLFMALIMHILKPEGRAAVVLPDGFLFGEGIQTRIKEKLLSEFNLHTIVRLPNGVFNPYTSIRTNILFFTKGKPTEHIWFYEHPYPDGVISYNKTKPMRFEEFSTEIEWWGTEDDGFATRVENRQAWKVPIKDIIERNYNLDLKNPNIEEQIFHDPAQLLSEFEAESKEIEKLQGEIISIFENELHHDSREAWERIRNNFKTIFNTSASIDQLKKVILDLAVMGKITLQQSSDEPINDVLNSIFEEKRKLVEEGKIRREKEFPDLTSDDIPFEVPDSWKWVYLEKITTINGGFAFKSNNYSDDGYRVIRISDFDENGFKDNNIVRHKYTKELEPFLLKEKNILLAMTGGTVGKSYLVQELNEPMIVNQSVATINIFNPISEQYIHLVIQSRFVQKIIDNAKNSTNDNISMGDIKGFKIPLPPISEQLRINLKVESLFGLCEELRSSILKADMTRNLLIKSTVQSD